MTVLAATEDQPRARIALEAGLRDAAALSHAYLFHGPSGSGKRAAAREFAAALIARDSADPDDTRRRVLSGVHPDLAWVEPRGAHEILVADVREEIVRQAALRPFEARVRVFVIADADRMNDESQNALLKTLEEPAGVRAFRTDQLRSRTAAGDDPVALPADPLRRDPAARAWRSSSIGARRRARDGARVCAPRGQATPIAPRGWPARAPSPGTRPRPPRGPR